VEKARGAIYWSENERRGPSPLELVRKARCKYPDLFRPALAKLKGEEERALLGVVSCVPVNLMTPAAREFANVLLRYTFGQLRGLI